MDKLNRQGVAQFDRFGSHQYSYEELIAEIGAGMLCELSGIQMNVQNSQAYLNGWISKLESEPKWIFKAVNEAKKAVELILGRSLATAVEPTEAEAEAE
jgi:antirestriction protein ArdC